MLKLFRAFEVAHSNAWIADQREGIGDKALDTAWQKSFEAEKALCKAIEELEAAATPPTI